MRLRVYCSPLPDKGALAVNVFSLAWIDLNLYLHPLIEKIMKTLAKTEKDKA